LPAGKLESLIGAQGVDQATVKTCAETPEVKNEITADIEAGNAIGIEGTPSFVIGALDDKGNVKGEVVVGAQPLASFEKIIDKYIK
jgi:protein-disulfide isomerase